MAINEQERIDAVNRYLKGDKQVDICRDANRSKKWLIGRINRFKTGEEWDISRCLRRCGLRCCFGHNAYAFHVMRVSNQVSYNCLNPITSITLSASS